MKTKHTQWSSNGLEIRSQSGMILANVYEHLPSNQSREEAEEIARLIASAPELLEALKEAQNQLIYLKGRLSGKEQRFTKFTQEVIEKKIVNVIKKVTE